MFAIKWNFKWKVGLKVLMEKFLRTKMKCMNEGNTLVQLAELFWNIKYIQISRYTASLEIMESFITIFSNSAGVVIISDFIHRILDVNDLKRY